jgi:hypothetical protein
VAVRAGCARVSTVSYCGVAEQCSHPALFPGARERARGREDDTDVGIGNLLGEEMRLGASEERHPHAHARVALDCRLELEQRGHDVCRVHPDDEGDLSACSLGEGFAAGTARRVQEQVAEHADLCADAVGHIHADGDMQGRHILQDRAIFDTGRRSCGKGDAEARNQACAVRLRDSGDNTSTIG